MFFFFAFFSAFSSAVSIGFSTVAVGALALTSGFAVLLRAVFGVVAFGAAFAVSDLLIEVVAPFTGTFAVGFGFAGALDGAVAPFIPIVAAPLPETLDDGVVAAGIDSAGFGPAEGDTGTEAAGGVAVGAFLLLL